ncbi:hypothetical protein ACNAN0_01330 [Agrilactobacillus fermenti]|uniref:hypothetical protein n=1 Tax=Agrilactobacillus fermenti TaxID=2586909 RepID=UPI003A5C3EEE
MMTQYKHIKLWLLLAIAVLSGGLLLLLGVGSVYGAPIAEYPPINLDPSFEANQPMTQVTPPNPPSAQGVDFLGLGIGIPGGFTQQPVASKTNYNTGEMVHFQWQTVKNFEIVLTTEVSYTVQLYQSQSNTWTKVIDKQVGVSPMGVRFIPSRPGKYIFQVTMDYDIRYWDWESMSMKTTAHKPSYYSQLLVVNVAPKPTPATSINISGTLSLFNGVPGRLQANVLPDTNTATIGNWKSADPDHLKISAQNGRIAEILGTLQNTQSYGQGAGEAKTVKVTVVGDNSGTGVADVLGTTYVKVGGLDPITVNAKTAGTGPITFSPYGLGDVTGNATYKWVVYKKIDGSPYVKLLSNAHIDDNKPTLQFKNVAQALGFTDNYFQLQVTSGGRTFYSNLALLKVLSDAPKQLTMTTMPNLKFAAPAGTNITIGDLSKKPVTLTQMSDTSGTGDNSNRIHISDTRASTSGWYMSLSMQPFSWATGNRKAVYGSNESGGSVSLQLKINEQKSTVKDDGKTTVVYRQDSPGDLDALINSAQLMISPTKDVYSGEYQSQLTWTAASVPDPTAP